METETLLEREWDVQYIDGEWRDAGARERRAVVNPASGETVTEVPEGTPADVDDAYAAASAAQTEWADRPPQERVAVIDDALDVLFDYEADLVDLLTVETGSAHEKATSEFGFTVGVMEEASSHAFRPDGDAKAAMTPGKDNVVKRVPVGTVGVITPWNFPLVLTMRAVAPALCLGNAVVLKPAPETPISGGLFVATLFDEAGLPDGLLNVVTGTGPVAGDAVASHPDAAVVSFTGSTEVGRQVGMAAVENLTFPALELGGNNPYIVTENADLDGAVDAGVYGSFHHAGQSCISINRHLVHESLYDEYVERLADRAAEVTVGDPRDESTDIGPIINESQRDSMMDFLEETVEAGAEIEVGGGYDGLFVEPTVVSGVDNDMPLGCNEHFGPIAPVIPFSSDEEAVELANDTEYGLTSAIQSQDIDQAWNLARRLDAGMVHVNDHTNVDDPQIPFGGTKDSGIGRYNGAAIIDEFTEPKWISVHYGDHDYPF